jgi:beta-lactamase superfamily II metal-dependent hydrolase
MFQINLLPARQGDSIWIKYGDSSNPHNLIVDGGPEKSKTLLSRIEREIQKRKKLHIDLLVVTHVDNDHIGGVLELIQAFPRGLTIGDIWFNAYRHLLPKDRLGPPQGDRLSRELDNRKGYLHWNKAFNGGPVSIPDNGDLPILKRQDSLELILLSPDRAQLSNLANVWEKAVEEAEIPAAEKPADLLGRKDEWPPDLEELAEQPFKSDKGEANGSSIAFIVKYREKRVLLGADAFASRLLKSLHRLPASDRKFEYFKLSHHGSKKSTDAALLKGVNCKNYLISTDGSYFGHPDAELIARILIDGPKNPTLFFNSLSDYTERWDEDIKGAPSYECKFPENEDDGIVIDII